MLNTKEKTYKHYKKEKKKTQLVSDELSLSLSIAEKCAITARARQFCSNGQCSLDADFKVVEQFFTLA